MKPLLVAVSQKDNKNGKRGDSLRCPIALALNRLTGSAYVWTVGRVTAIQWSWSKSAVLRDALLLCENFHSYFLQKKWWILLRFLIVREAQVPDGSAYLGPGSQVL